MRKNVYVLNAIELLGQLMNGKRVEGVLYIDQNTGKLTFKAYNRQCTREGPTGEEVALGLGERVDRAHQGVRQFPEGLLYGADHRVAQRAHSGRKECAHRQGTGLN